MKKIKYIDIKEFREKGYLQEVNRQFLHPLGLALEIINNNDGSESLGGVWDYRNDPEGIAYGEIKESNKRKFEFIKKETEKRSKIRQKILGYIIQPI